MTEDKIQDYLQQYLDGLIIKYSDTEEEAGELKEKLQPKEDNSYKELTKTQINTLTDISKQIAFIKAEMKDTPTHVMLRLHIEHTQQRLDRILHDNQYKREDITFLNILYEAYD